MPSNTIFLQFYWLHLTPERCVQLCKILYSSQAFGSIIRQRADDFCTLENLDPYLNTQGKDAGTVSTGSGGKTAIAPPAGGSHPGSQLAYRELRRAHLECIHAIPDPTDKRIYIMAFYGFDWLEIQASLLLLGEELSTGAIYQRYWHTRAQVRQCVRDKGYSR